MVITPYLITIDQVTVKVIELHITTPHVMPGPGQNVNRTYHSYWSTSQPNYIFKLKLLMELYWICKPSFIISVTTIMIIITIIIIMITTPLMTHQHNIKTNLMSLSAIIITISKTHDKSTWQYYTYISPMRRASSARTTRLLIRLEWSAISAVSLCLAELNSST